MLPWLRQTTWFQRVALALIALAILSAIYTYIDTRDFSFGGLISSLLIALVAFRKPLLWRVRNRLALTYFLFGIVPLLLIYFLLELTAILVLGQFASGRARQAFDSRIQSIYIVTQDLSNAAEEGSTPALLEEIRGRERGLISIVQVNGHAIMASSPGSAFSAVPDWIKPGFRGVFGSAG
jgi:hypothetical protein